MNKPDLLAFTVRRALFPLPGGIKLRGDGANHISGIFGADLMRAEVREGAAQNFADACSAPAGKLFRKIRSFPDFAGSILTPPPKRRPPVRRVLDDGV